MTHFFALVCVLFVWTTAAAAQSVPSATPPVPRAARAVETLPRVHMLATGGTISNRDGGRLTADQIRTLLAHGDYFLSPAEYERRIAVKLVLHTKQLFLEAPTEWAAEPHRGMRRRLDWGVVVRGLRQQVGRTLRREHTPRWEPTDHPVPSGH